MDYINLQQAAERFPLAYSTLAQYAREGKFQTWRVGKIWLTTEEAIEKAIATGLIGRYKGGTTPCVSIDTSK